MRQYRRSPGAVSHRDNLRLSLLRETHVAVTEAEIATADKRLKSSCHEILA